MERTGYKTAEEIAVELDITVKKVKELIKELQIPATISYPTWHNNRQHFTPEDIARIRQALQNGR